MSGFDAGKSRRRADAQRNAEGIVDSAAALLGRSPDASMDDIAAAAGVTRQTVYAHFRSRQTLVDAVTEQVTARVVAALETIDVDEGTAASALRRWVDVAWSLLERYPVLLTPAIPTSEASDQIERHAPVISQLSAIIRRGQRAHEFDPSLPLDWIIAATIALGHAAGARVAAGSMAAEEAGALFASSLLRVCGVTPTQR